MNPQSSASVESVRKTVTMKDVALHAGVHHSSVSVVLNGSRSSAGISAATRQRILDAAAELGYRRNGSAHTIRTGRFGNIALLLSTNRGNSYLPPQLLAGLYDTLTQLDMTLTICLLPDDELNETGTLPKILREQMCDGLLIDYNKRIPEPMVETIQRHQIPAVWINSKQPADCVYPDDFEAGKQATRYLLELGHRRITYTDLVMPRPDDPDQHYSRQDRRDGYLAVMADAGFEAQVWDMNTLDLGDIESHLAILNGAAPPTAIVNYASWATEGLVYAAVKLGFKMPDDLSVVSFGPEQNLFFSKRMTVLVEPQYNIGQAATRMLLGKIDHPLDLSPSHREPFFLCEGKSTAPVSDTVSVSSLEK